MRQFILKYINIEDYARDQEDTTGDMTTDGTMMYMLVGIGVAVIVIP